MQLFPMSPKHLLALFLCFTPLITTYSQAEVLVARGFSLHGEPKYPYGFNHFDYVNPDAPKGGKVTLPALGTFDTLNPYVFKGISPYSYIGVYGIAQLNEPLMVGTGGYLPSGDEPQTAYCLVCSHIEYTNKLDWVTFEINPEAKFHNGTPITAEDVEFTYKLLQSEKAHPRYQDIYRNIASVEVLSKHRIKFHFSEPGNRGLILRLGEMPVMSQDFWKENIFGKSSTKPQPLSGPYKVSKFKLGKFIELERVPDHWAKNHPVYQGAFNFQKVRFVYFRDRTVAFEAFKSGEVDLWIEYVAKNWATAYDFPAINDGRALKRGIPHQIPSGSQAFFMNMRNPLFQDRRVRQAITLLFDFEWINRQIFNSAYRRSNTYFPNSELASSGLPEEGELALLLPHKDTIQPELLTEPFAFPVNKGNGRLRQQVLKALRLFEEAGWKVKNGRMTNLATGKIFDFENANRPAIISARTQPLSQESKEGGY